MAIFQTAKKFLSPKSGVVERKKLLNNSRPVQRSGKKSREAKKQKKNFGECLSKRSLSVSQRADDNWANRQKANLDVSKIAAAAAAGVQQKMGYRNILPHRHLS